MSDFHLAMLMSSAFIVATFGGFYIIHHAGERYRKKHK